MTEYGERLKTGAKWAFGAMADTAGTFASESGGSYIFPIIATIVAITLIVIVVFTIIQSRRQSPKKEVVGPLNLYAPKSPVVVDRQTARAQMNASYTLSFYLRVDAVPDMRATATPLFTWPSVWMLGYNPSQEQLVWQFMETPDAATSVAGYTPIQKVILPGVPLQKWTQVTITLEGRTVDMYVNGALRHSVLLNNLPPAGNSSITIVPDGIMGQAAYVQVWPRRLSIAEVAANYTDTSDSQGQPYLGPQLMTALKGVTLPNLFCPGGSCVGNQPAAAPSQTWEFPYQ